MQNIVSKMIMGTSIIVFSIILNTKPSSAQDCVPNDCEAMGYTKTAASCAGVDFIKCPFDTSKVFCQTKGCPAGYQESCDSSYQKVIDTKVSDGKTCYSCDAKNCMDWGLFDRDVSSPNLGDRYNQCSLVYKNTSSSTGRISCYSCSESRCYGRPVSEKCNYCCPVGVSLSSLVMNNCTKIADTSATNNGCVKIN